MRKKHNVQDIIRIGEEIIRKNGYHNTGINDILRASSIPKGSFYNYFNSKELFGRRLLEHEGAEISELMQTILEDESKQPLERLQAFYDKLIKRYDKEECRYGSLVANLSSELGGEIDLLAGVANLQFEQWMLHLANCIRAGQREGQITEAYTAEELAHYLHTNFFGALTRGKVLRNTRPLKLTLKMAFDFIAQRKEVGYSAWKI